MSMETMPREDKKIIKTETEATEPAPDLGAQGQEAQEPKPEDQKEKIIMAQDLKGLFAGELKDGDKENIINKTLEIIREKNGYDLRLKLDDKSEYLADTVDSCLIDQDNSSVNIKTIKGKEFAVEFDFDKDDVSIAENERTDDRFVVNLYKELADKYGKRGDLIDQKKSANNKEEIDKLNQKLQGVNSKINYLYEKIVELDMNGLIDEEKKKVEKIGKFIEKEKGKRADRSVEFMSGVEGADLVDDKIGKQGGFKSETKEPSPEPEEAQNEYGFKKGNSIVVVRTNGAVDLEGWFVHEINSNGKIIVIKPDEKNWHNDLFKIIDAKELKSWQEKYKAKPSLENQVEIIKNSFFEFFREVIRSEVEEGKSGADIIKGMEGEKNRDENFYNKVISHYKLESNDDNLRKTKEIRIKMIDRLIKEVEMWKIRFEKKEEEVEGDNQYTTVSSQTDKEIEDEGPSQAGSSVLLILERKRMLKRDFEKDGTKLTKEIGDNYYGGVEMDLEKMKIREMTDEEIIEAYNNNIPLIIPQNEDARKAVAERLKKILGLDIEVELEKMRQIEIEEFDENEIRNYYIEKSKKTEENYERLSREDKETLLKTLREDVLDSFILESFGLDPKNEEYKEKVLAMQKEIYTELADRLENKSIITPEVVVEEEGGVPRGITEAIRTLEKTEEKLFKVIADIPNEDRMLAIKHNRGERLSPGEVEIAKGVNTLQELKTVVSIDTLSAMIAKSRYMSFEEGRKMRRIVLEEMTFLKDAEKRALFHAEKNLNEMIARKEIEPIKVGAVNRFAKAVVKTREIETPATPPASPEAGSQEGQEKKGKGGIFNKLKRFVGIGKSEDEKKAEKDVKYQKTEIKTLENELESENLKGVKDEKKMNTLKEKIYLAKKKLEELEAKKKEIEEKANEQEKLEGGKEGAESLNKKIESAKNVANLQGVFDYMWGIGMITNDEKYRKQFQEKVADKINSGSDEALKDVIACSIKEITGINASKKISQENKDTLVKFYGKVVEVAEKRNEKLKKFDSQFNEEEFDKLDKIKEPSDLKSVIQLLESIIDIITEGVLERRIDVEGRGVGRLHGKDLGLNYYFDTAFKDENKTKTGHNETVIWSLENDRKIFADMPNNELKNAKKYASKVFDVIDRLRKEILKENEEKEPKEKEKGARTRIDALGSGSGKEGKEQKVDEEKIEPVKIDGQMKEGIKKGLEKIKKDNEEAFWKIGGLANSFSKDERLFGDVFTKEWFDNYMKDIGIKYEEVKDIKTKDFMAVMKVAYEEVKGERKDNKKPPKPEGEAGNKEKGERQEGNKSPVIEIKQNTETIKRLQEKLQECKQDLQKKRKNINPYKAPEQDIKALENTRYKIAIIEKLLSTGSVSTHELSREILRKDNKIHGEAFNEACEEMKSFVKTGKKEKQDSDKKPPEPKGGAGGEEKVNEGEKPESWYEKTMKDKTPIYIQVKIPTGSEYSGYKEKGDMNVEGYHEWNINNWGKEKLKLKSEAEENELLISKEGEILSINFRKNYALDKRYKEKRDANGWIAYRFSKEKMEKLWNDLKNNPSAAYNLIDSELLKLIGLPFDLKVILKEEGKRLEVKKKEKESEKEAQSVFRQEVKL